MIKNKLNNKLEKSDIVRYQNVLSTSFISQAFLFGENSLVNKIKKLVVYQIYCRVNKKSYIGITSTFKKRMREHFNYQNGCKLLSRTIKKYTKKNFNAKIIDTADSWEKLCKKEILYIKKLKTKAPLGMNLTDGGEGLLGHKMSKETKLKISKANKGKIITEEMRKKISKTLTGRKLSLELCKKLSKARMGRVFSKKTKKKMSNSSKGKKHSKETRKLLSEIHMGHTLSEKTKKKISIAAMGRKHTKKSILKMKKVKQTLTKNQVKEIKKMIAKKIPYRIIAPIFNICESSVSNIKKGDTYTNKIRRRNNKKGNKIMLKSNYEICRPKRKMIRTKFPEKK